MVRPRLQCATQSVVQPPKALREWRGQYELQGQLTDEGQQRWRARVRSFIGGDRGAAAKAKARPKAKPLADKYVANIHDLRGLENSFQRTFGIGLSHFVPEVTCKALKVGERRFWVMCSKLPAAIQASSGDRIRRSCIKYEDGSASRLEAPLGGSRNVLHTWCDMGSIGWYGRHLLFLQFGLRGSWGLDPSHRRWDDQLLNLTASGLQLIKLEILTVQVFLSGPWAGDGNYRKIQDAIAEWHSNSTPEDPLFVLVYPRIVKDVHRGRMPPDMGSPEHKQHVWDSMNGMMEEFAYGMNTKQKRWFQPIDRHRTFSIVWNLLLAG